MEIEDLFGEDNPYYKKAIAFPVVPPIGASDVFKRFKTDIEPGSDKKTPKRKNFPKQPRRQVEKVIEDIYEIENYNDDFEFLENLIIEDAGNFSSKKIDLYSRETTRNKLEDLLNKVEEFDEQELVMMKKLHSVGINVEEYQNYKCIKLANIFHFNKEMKNLFEPNFISESIYFLSYVNSPSYIEYFLDYSLRKYISYNIKGFVIPQEKYSNRLYELKKRKVVEKHVSDIEDFHINQEKVSNLIQYINNQTDKEGLSFFLGIKTVRGGKNIHQQEIDNLENLLFYLTIASFLIMDEKATMVIKIYNTFLPRTVEFLFLFYSLFKTITIMKPITSSVISNHKFFVMKNINNRVRKLISTQLLENFDLILNNKNLCILNEDIIRDDTDFTINFVEYLNFTMVSKFLFSLEKLIDTGDLKIADTQKLQIIQSLENWRLTMDLDDEMNKTYREYKERLERTAQISEVPQSMQQNKWKTEKQTTNQKELLNPDINFVSQIKESSKKIEESLVIMSALHSSSKSNSQKPKVQEKRDTNSSLECGLLSLIKNTASKPNNQKSSQPIKKESEKAEIKAKPEEKKGPGRDEAFGLLLGKFGDNKKGTKSKK